MPRTTTVEDDIGDAIATAIDGVTGIVAEEVYRYPRANFHSEVPCAFVVVDDSQGLNRVDDKRHWQVRVSILLVALPADIAKFKAWVLNALEDDETLGGLCGKLNYEPWEFGYPIGGGEGSYAWVETAVTAVEHDIERGKNIESS